MLQEDAKSSRPGEKALKVMKIVEEVDIFKKPTSVPIKRLPKKVLDEDSYVQEMGRIIQRDFFPDLEKLKAQNEYLEALERNDVEKLREIYAKYSSGKRPPTERYASPATFETPLDARREDDHSERDSETRHQNQIPEKEGSVPDDEDENKLESNKQGTHPSLDEYLNSHTSEDNQSFQEIMREADVKHRHKFAWLYKAEQDSAADQTRMLMVPSIEVQAGSIERPLMVDTWGYRNKNYIMYVPEAIVPLYACLKTKGEGAADTLTGCLPLHVGRSQGFSMLRVIQTVAELDLK